jgi:hypothetical protein
MNKINYYRFCCRIRIADEYADEVPGGEYLAVEIGDLRERHEQFSDARLNEFSDWFTETPALLAHVRALQTGRNPDPRSRLVDTEGASTDTNRTRQDLYALARRGAVTRYRTRLGLRDRVLWDPLELEKFQKKDETGG